MVVSTGPISVSSRLKLWLRGPVVVSDYTSHPLHSGPDTSDFASYIYLYCLLVAWRRIANNKIKFNNLDRDDLVTHSITLAKCQDECLLEDKCRSIDYCPTIGCWLNKKKWEEDGERLTATMFCDYYVYGMSTVSHACGTKKNHTKCRVSDIS